jgi:putative glutamine amidotransferase
MDMEQPLKTKLHCHARYFDAVAEAGGVPVLIPPYTDPSMLAEALKPLAGFCFVGGLDYLPAHYGGHAQPAADLVPPRKDAFDLHLAKLILEKTTLPVLGLCGGHQLLSLARGGALVQDLRTEWKPSDQQASTLLHSEGERAGTPEAGNAYRHQVKLAPDSLIARIVGAPKLLTNSFHHQAVRPERVGDGLVATGWASDGVIEALELKTPDRFFLGVQWHPERLMDERPHRAILEALVAAAGK